MSIASVKRIGWEVGRDTEGHRTYHILHLVETTSTLDGPAIVLSDPSIPQIGDTWFFGNDIDVWAFCWPDAEVKLYNHPEFEPWRYWTVKSLFTTKPLDRCQDTEIEDPLLEPDKISGGFLKYTRESSKDKDDLVIKSSSHEIFTGPEVEWDENRPTVRIEQNRADLELDVLAQLMDHVNDAILWGLAVRSVKFSNATWQRKWYGVCNIYYTRNLEFDINFDTFDREIPDQGKYVLPGKWTSKTPPTWTPDGGTDKTDPRQFVNFKDVNGENKSTLLDGNGNPLIGTTPTTISFKKYTASNLLLLSIPTVLT